MRSHARLDRTIVVIYRVDESKEEGEGNSELVCWLTCAHRGYVHWSVGPEEKGFGLRSLRMSLFGVSASHPFQAEAFSSSDSPDSHLTTPAVHISTRHYKGQRPINVPQEVDTDLISQWTIISGLTRHWFVQGPKVVVSVFNTLNTIDWSSRGVMRNGRIKADSERFGVKTGEELMLLVLNMLPSSRFALLCM